MKTKLIQAGTIQEFDSLCEKAVEDGFMFVGQVIMCGLGQGKFLYTQQWAKGAEDEVQQPDTKE
jgi:hypothetical protein